MAAKGSGHGFDALIKRFLLHKWVLKKPDILIQFLEETKNPYLANILTVIATNQDSSSISVEEAIEKIKNSSGIEDIVELFEYISVADVWSGGTSKGFYHTGVYKEFVEREVKTKLHFGVSVGAIPAILYSLRMQGEDYGIDTSPEHVEEFSHKVADSLLPKGFKNSKVDIYSRIFYDGPLIDTADMEKLVENEFKNIKVKQVKNLYISVSNLTKGKKILISTHDPEYKETTLYGAFRKTSAYPHMFKLVEDDKQIYADGGIYGLPLREVFESGADLALVSLLNHYIHDLEEDHKYKGIFGHIGLSSRQLEIMYKGQSSEAIHNLTGKAPEYVADHGDSHGKLILLLPDLSNITSFDFGGECRNLIDLGKADASKALDKFLDPKYEHPDYNVTNFLMRRHLERN